MSGGLAYAQFPSAHSMYMFDQLMINPAYAGGHGQFSAMAIHQNQLQKFPGAPKNTIVTAHSSLAQNKMGLGLLFTHQVTGAHTDQSLFMSYSYKFKMPTGELSMGVQAGVQSLKTETWLVAPVNPNISSFITGIEPNFGTGLHYTNKDFFVGFSVPYLLNRGVISGSTGVLSDAKRRRSFYLTAGNAWNISPKFKFVPAALIQVQEDLPLNFDLNTHIVYKDALGLGAGYRLKEGLVLMSELKLNEEVYVGYAYNVAATDIQKYSGGVHEIMLNYRYRIPQWHKGMERPSFF